MNKNITHKKLFVYYIIINLICTGIGMGIPVLNILLGFLTGHILAKQELINNKNIGQVLKNIYTNSLYTTLVTFILMLIIWIPIAVKLFDPNFDYAHFGIPLWLYEAKISFIGWIILMTIISPFMQLLTTIFSAYLTIKK